MKIALLLLVAAIGLPVYPGAAHVADTTNEGCNTKVTTAVYRISGADWHSVANWYSGRMPGTISVSTPGHPNGVELFTPDGRKNVAVGETGSTTIVGLNAFDPPIASGQIADMQAASHGDPAAKARLKAACPDSEQ